ncbi:MAG: 16S rRNA (guanine(527)-N(7))-methyltransferase RsmG [Sphingobium sp.]|nr:16S rRNA (guanine(527)-N(7))-methyltransferase RsmG [Sphingobium sp.]MCI1270342.1 16S rRNA (guanine(527)-N(7))-methyltransferase RsmG [Sphingobium sp.]MCI1755489.1 16S rRNA (guanine(527)-N(7))-methyltransferase RsmG [Sphingobium sp.]MCI2052133.1 16S rRNA (guanine(527)-N(7))-methyltransferase RsmG [Sphingobium sp.]
MTEEEARAWLQSTFDVSRETWGRLERFVELLLAESRNQNLIAESTQSQVWARHIVDSAQLLPLAGRADGEGNGLWVDLGAGAGLPGIVVAILSERPLQMIEMRRKRVEFLEAVIAELGLGNAQVVCGKVERVANAAPAAIISARAYAPMERLLSSARHLADFSTIWLLPKGQNHQNELAIAQQLWHCEASIEPSITAPDSAILKLSHVRPRQAGHQRRSRKAGGKA